MVSCANKIKKLRRNKLEMGNEGETSKRIGASVKKATTNARAENKGFRFMALNDSIKMNAYGDSDGAYMRIFLVVTQSR